MSELRRIDTDLATLLATMQLEPSKDSIAMVDVETNNPKANKFNRLRVFDFGHGTLNPFTGNIGKIESNIVYEGIINPEVANQILEWKKIKTASFDSYYGFFKLLMAHNWWADDVISKEEIAAESIGAIKVKAREKLYKIQNRTLPRLETVLKGWENERAHYKDAKRHATNRRAEIAKNLLAIEDLEKMLKTEDTLDQLVSSGEFIGNPSYESIMRGVYTDFYRSQHEQLNWESDLAFFQELEKKTKTSFSQDVRQWKDVIGDFDASLRNNKDLLAITAYNITHEQNAINTMSKDFGAPDQVGLLNGEEYRSICMKNMIGLISKKEVGDIISGMNAFDPKGFEEQVAKALNETGKLQTKSFEVLYNNVFPAREYGQKHTAPDDVFDQSEVFIEAFERYVIPQLEKSKGAR